VLGALAAVVALTAAVLVAVQTGRDSGGGEAAGPIATLRTGDFHSLAFSPDNADTVFFGYHNGVMHSDDGGRTWRALVERPNFDAMNLAVSRADPRRVYLAGHDIFQTSADGGASWQPVAHTLPGTDIHGFAMSPDDPNRLYVFVVGHGLFGSTDAGRTWQRLGALPPDVMSLSVPAGGADTLYAGSMRAGVLRSSDGGRTWAPVAGLGRMVYTVAAGSGAGQTVFAGVDGGLYRGTNGGAAWEKLSFPGENAVAIAVSPARPEVVLAIAVKDRQGMVYRSEDGGRTWAGR
jgi:photosystem II stability/assembly factor-like uncharacterized protein